MLRVLYRDDLVLALDKPAGVLSVPGRGEGQQPALSELARELAADVLPVHRLDKGTSGVQLLALGKDAHRALNRAFESRKAEKRYLALVRGVLAGPVTSDAPLVSTRRGGMRTARAGEEGAQHARTDFTPVESFEGFTWVEARPQTGRTHQIRVHLAALGHALAVDERYGDGTPLRASQLDPQAGDDEVLARTPLHASAIRLPHPSGRGWLSVEAPLPDDLARCLALLRKARRYLP